MHNGHLKAIEQLAKKHGRIIIIIGSAQHKRTDENPLSASERKRMIAYCLQRRGILRKTTVILLRDEHENKKWAKKIVSLLGRGKDVTAYSNNRLVRRLLRPYYCVKKMVSGINLNSTKVREAMRSGGNWKAMVPTEVAEFLEKNGLVEVIAGSAP